jgi:hypothetical protein
MTQTNARPDAPGGDDGPSRRRIEGRGDFLRTLEALLQEAAQGHWPMMCFCAPHFLDWPLGSVSVVESLTAWAQRGGQRHCDFVALDFDRWPQMHPRWVRWYQTWAHLVNCWQAADEFVEQLPTALVLTRPDETLLLELTNSHYQTGWLHRGDTRAGALRREVDVILQRSSVGFSASVLGL